MEELKNIPNKSDRDPEVKAFKGSFQILPPLNVDTWLILMELNRTVRVKRDFSPNPEPPYVPKWIAEIIEQHYYPHSDVDRWGEDGIFYTHLLEMIRTRPLRDNFTEKDYDRLVKEYGLDSGREDETNLILGAFEVERIRLEEENLYLPRVNPWVPTGLSKPGEYQNRLQWDEYFIPIGWKDWLKFIKKFLSLEGYHLGGQITIEYYDNRPPTYLNAKDIV